MSTIFACIDGSSHASAVGDCASWASLRLNRAPVTFLHVQPKDPSAPTTNLSGNIGIGSQEQLLAQLVALDTQRNKIATEHGRLLLEAAQSRALKVGVVANTLQRHGDLIPTLVDLQPNTRLLVMGRRGEDNATVYEQLGSHVEQAIRALHCPILITQGKFSAPKKVMLAFDGSPTMRGAISLLADSSLLNGLELYLVSVGNERQAQQEQLNWARTLLEDAEGEMRVYVHNLEGDAEQVLTAFIQQHKMDMLVMGAYGHSRIRRWLVGSITTTMLRASKVPLLILR